MELSLGKDEKPYPRHGVSYPERRRRGGRMKSKRKYAQDMPRRLYTFFTSYSDTGAPSIAKFARSIGATVADVESFRIHKEFERAYRECSEIRRDYLIDNALCRRFDSSLVKFLLGYEFGMEDEAADNTLDVKIEVKD